MKYITWGEMQSHIEGHFAIYRQPITLLDMINYINLNFLLPPPIINLAVPPAPGEFSDDDFERLINGHLLPIIALPGRDALTVFQDVIMYRHFSHLRKEIHAHPYYEINYVYRGTCAFSFEETRQMLRAGQLCVIAPAARHFIEIDEPDSLVFAVMIDKNTFNSKFFPLLTHDNLLAHFCDTLLNEHARNNYLLLTTDNPIELKRTIRNMAAEFFRNDAYSKICCCSWVNLMLSITLRCCSDARQHRESRCKPDFNVIYKHVQQNYCRLTLGNLADHFHYSESYLSLLFRRNLGCNFCDVVKKLKMAQATDLLINSHLKVADIAEAAGFNSADHFSRVFRSLYRLSPRQYRQAYQISTL